MSQLMWIRLDVGLRSNPKILTLLSTKDGYPAAWLYMCGLMYAGEHGTDGWIPAEAIPTFGGCYSGSYRGRYQKLLVQHGLWEPSHGGFVIHDWADFQATSEASRARSARAREAARARWNGHRALTNAEKQRAYRDRRAGRTVPPDF
jgi:hypothetical protein